MAKGKNPFGEEIDNQHTRDAGEYLICAILSRWGISCGLLKEGMQDVDILATVDGAKTMSLQMKSSARQGNPQFNIEITNSSENFFVVFMNWEDMKFPEFYIVPSEDITHMKNKKGNSKTYVGLPEIKDYKGCWKSILKYFWPDKIIDQDVIALKNNPF